MRFSILLIVAIITVSIISAEPLYYKDMTVSHLVKSENISDDKSSSDELFNSEDVLSIKSAFLLSLAIPGAGEFYSKSYIKSAGFFAAEAAFWGGFAYYMGQYSSQRQEFRDYADQHWIKDTFIVWYDSICALKDTSELGIEILPDTKTQQYYEMIGKYDWFTIGWDDIINRPEGDFYMIVDSTYGIAIVNQTSEVHDEIVKFLSGFPSPHRDYYMNMRSDANEKYSTAKYFVGAAILNHLLSAFDAAFTAKKHNDKLYRGFSGIKEIKLTPSVAMRNGKPIPILTCVINW
ncbi:hypothetical protein J7L68_09135 [bacterium]|nr:hypothetical protein [bacterium]